MRNISRTLPRTLLVSTAAFLALVSLAFAQETTFSARNRIVAPIDESDVVTLVGNTHPMARPDADRGPVADETRLERMVLLLQPDVAQQKALDELTEAQQQPNSPLYHRWLTPQEYGVRFGVSPSDLAKIAGWLQSHGFSVEPVPAGRRTLLFSGTAAQVADTFHTEIHQFQVDGAKHIANTQDPQIPRVLAAVVSGVLSLHDFRRQSAIRSIEQVAAPVTRKPSPENSQGSTHYIFPADYATIYDLNPQYAAGKNGSGASIAIVGRSNINLSDVSTFRSNAGLIANQPTVIFDGGNPGLVSGDQDESTLDVEWSGGVAPGAAVTFVVGDSTATTDGVDLSAQYIVNHKTANVMSTSYGNCEAYMGSGALSFYNSLWQQAASEGISSFVSSGDSGAAGCNGGSSSSGTMNGVNGLCSSPYSTCVGGTEFNEGSNSAAYWSNTNGAGGGSALSYIPEKVWNESASDGGSGLWASTGGISIAYTQPSWQAGVPGANSNGMRAVPDVALTAAGHDGYLICENGNFYIIAGTSAASPSFAGIMSIVNQKQGGAGQGNANPALYGMLEAATNPFHATPTGNNSVPGVTGFTASGAAYNLATGLGSVDANLLVNEWSGGSGGGGTTQPGFTLHASAASESLLPGKTATFTVSVTATGSFSSAVALKATAPSGVTVTLSSASVKPGSSTTLTIGVSAGAAPATGDITITGTSGAITETATVPMTVLGKPSLALAVAATKVSVAQGASVTLQFTSTTGGSYSGTVALAVTALPSGVSATWTNGSFSASGAGSTVSTLTLKASTAASLATTAFQVTATGDGLTATASSSVQVTAAPAISAALSPASLGMLSMGTATVTVTVTPIGGVSLASSASTASFKVAGLPGGITGSWGAAALTASGTLQAHLTLTGSTSALASLTKAVVSVSVTDSVSEKVYSASAIETLTVSHVLPTLTISPAATKASLVKGQSGTLQVTATTGGSYAGQVVLGVVGLPAGVTATWTQGSFARSTAGSTTSTLTLKAASSAAVASTVFRITATGDGITAQSSATVQVTPAPAIALSLSPASVSMKSNASQAVVVTATPVGAAQLASTSPAVSFQVVGLPTGITSSWGSPSLTASGAVQETVTFTGSASAVTSNTKPAITGKIADQQSGNLYTATIPLTLAVTRASSTQPASVVHN